MSEMAIFQQQSVKAGGSAFGRVGGAYKAGAPSFARFAKGGNHGRLHQGFAHAAGTQNREKVVAAAGGVQKRQAIITRTGDKVQVVGAVTAMQTAGHDTLMVQASLLPALAKNARTGHPFPRLGKKQTKGWATRRNNHRNVLQLIRFLALRQTR